jgi:hypothetical protein
MGTSLRSFTHPTKKLDEYVYVGWVKEQRDVPIKIGDKGLHVSIFPNSNELKFNLY